MQVEKWQVTKADEQEQVEDYGSVFRPAGWYRLNAQNMTPIGPFETEDAADAAYLKMIEDNEENFTRLWTLVYETDEGRGVCESKAATFAIAVLKFKRDVPKEHHGSDGYITDDAGKEYPMDW